MNGNNILVDTSVFINFFNGSYLAKEIFSDSRIWFASITEIELLSYPHLSNSSVELMRDFLSQCNIVELTSSIRETTISIRRQKKLKVPDAIIAATAMSLKMPLITFDTDFAHVDGLSAVILEH